MRCKVSEWVSYHCYKFAHDILINKSLRTFNLAFQKLAALWWTLGNNLGRFNVFEIDLPQMDLFLSACNKTVFLSKMIKCTPRGKTSWNVLVPVILEGTSTNFRLEFGKKLFLCTIRRGQLGHRNLPKHCHFTLIFSLTRWHS
jgi:hypothetical protein